MPPSYTNGFARAPERVHRFAAVQQVLGLLLMLFSLSMLPPLLVSWYYDDGAARAFGTGLWITLAFGAIVWWPARRAQVDLRLRDGFLVTVLFWAVLSAFGAIPLYIAESGWHTYTDALFESVSGLTTTGATVVASGLDRLPHSILYYRAQLHWLGGMGIIVLAVAVLPMLGVGGMQLLRAETPGPMKDAKLTPRIASTARALWLIYVGLTVVCMLTYWALGMTPFDAVCHAFSTLATGGFSTHDASFGFFNSLHLEIACMVFMVLASANFALHFTVWSSRNPLAYFRDAEFRTFLLIVTGFALIVCLPLYFSGTYADFGTAMRKGLFHVISYGTTTGFGTTDPSPWPLPLPLILMLCSFMVGCAGSTAGGVKVVRMMLFTRQAIREMQRLIH
ncbi:MAG: potassium transporter, partial [Hydrocarboniphaga effusa]|nr:potassium transporter [Hydrocarboniphaga effusa]